MEQLSEMDFRKLDLGSGRWRKEGYLGIDTLEAAEYQGVTEEDKQWILQWDLNKGIPFPSNTITDVFISHFLEHVQYPSFLLYEIHRVCIHGAHVEIYVPLHEMKSVGHLTEFDEQWFERTFLLEFGGKFSIVRKEVQKGRPVKILTPDGVVDGVFDELNIVFKVVK